MSRGAPRIVFVTGLEHSGTTLLAYYLSGSRAVTVLGEAHTLLDDDARGRFFARWGQFNDAELCSCGTRHRHCPIWSETVADIAFRPARETKARYRDLLSRFEAEDVLIDSSKSLDALQILIGLFNDGVASELKVVLVAKDPRAFLTSMKKVRNLGLRGQMSALNWWCGANAETIDYLVESGLGYFVVRYEDVCLEPDATFARLQAFVGLETADNITTEGKTHICMGNKGFINARNKAIRYDDRWRREKIVRALYACHARARRMNAELVTGSLGPRGAVAT